MYSALHAQKRSEADCGVVFQTCSVACSKTVTMHQRGLPTWPQKQNVSLSRKILSSIILCKLIGRRGRTGTKAVQR